MVYGLPSWGDTPVDPHSAFTHLKNYPIDGGFVDGPVYTSIYKNLIGIKLYQPDEYEDFQSDWLFIMMTMAITAPMNQQWMEQLH